MGAVTVTCAGDDGRPMDADGALDSETPGAELTGAELTGAEPTGAEPTGEELTGEEPTDGARWRNRRRLRGRRGRPAAARRRHEQRTEPDGQDAAVRCR